ncbi:MAG: D-aminoacyl-tRNA deacylase [Candidatus Omnitrophica bacterium]|jgi:D-tyrosyl-tRNA(Tyr) deacylase|nr:D-aminoacyl-tRNA deacylase [Candidatus Omnitrophota bacterium]
MKAVILRVAKASLSIPNETKESISIGRGLVIFVGIDKKDNDATLEDFAEKVTNLRIFDDENGKLDFSLKDKNYEILCVPNFTLCANINKGRRPSFENVMPQDAARKLFENLIILLGARGLSVKSGKFGKTMVINTECIGPVNLVVEI